MNNSIKSSLTEHDRLNRLRIKKIEERLKTPHEHQRTHPHCVECKVRRELSEILEIQA